MKIFLISILSMFAASKSTVGQEISLASILETKISISIDADGIAESVHELIAATRADMPEVQKIKYIFDGTQKFQTTPKQRMVFEKEKIRRILDLIGIIYRHDVRYDLAKGRVSFIAATGGEDPSREFRFSEELSKQMDLDWSNEAHAIKSIYKHGVIANVEKINIHDRSVVLKGRLAELDYLDMVIVVCGRKELE